MTASSIQNRLGLGLWRRYVDRAASARSTTYMDVPPARGAVSGRVAGGHGPIIGPDDGFFGGSGPAPPMRLGLGLWRRYVDRAASARSTTHMDVPPARGAVSERVAGENGPIIGPDDGFLGSFFPNDFSFLCSFIIMV